MNIPMLNIVGLFAFGILTFCLGIYRITNGRMIEITRRLDKSVNRPECHRAQERMEKHMDERFDDLKDLINGKK